ncbi:hypothetical protein AFLA_009491 [Aspergillus flavus NRRL3357]|nr:hypothetical protein AFLA_009491 [Aspergillus flavus NRRL3357]
MLRLSSTANLNFPPTSEKLNQLEPSGARLINWDSLRSFLPALVLPFIELSMEFHDKSPECNKSAPLNCRYRGNYHGENPKIIGPFCLCWLDID